MREDASKSDVIIGTIGHADYKKTTLSEAIDKYIDKSQMSGCSKRTLESDLQEKVTTSINSSKSAEFDRILQCATLISLLYNKRELLKLMGRNENQKRFMMRPLNKRKIFSSRDYK